MQGSTRWNSPRGDDHRVDVFAFEELAVVLIDGPVAFPLGLERLGPRQIAVAQGDDLPVLGQLIEQQSGPAADADRADGDPLVRAGLPSAARTPEGMKYGTPIAPATPAAHLSNCRRDTLFIAENLQESTGTREDGRKVGSRKWEGAEGVRLCTVGHLGR